MIARYEIKGGSMEPGLKEGDRVLLLRTKNMKKGDVVVFSAAGRDCIKRVSSVARSSFFAEGDNKQESTDSRHYGAIHKKQVVGKVFWRY
ncbi:S26 family signal peptidase [Candidatus Woesearchaeota archaeon]|nr:S26 family signal peptidase [Candidatus Woesearchaeota archaeon]